MLRNEEHAEDVGKLYGGTCVTKYASSIEIRWEFYEPVDVAKISGNVPF